MVYLKSLRGLLAASLLFGAALVTLPATADAQGVIHSAVLPMRLYTSLTHRSDPGAPEKCLHSMT